MAKNDAIIEQLANQVTSSKDEYSQNNSAYRSINANDKDGDNLSNVQTTGLLGNIGQIMIPKMTN